MDKPLYRRIIADGYKPTQEEVEHMAMDLSKVQDELDELRCDLRRDLEELLYRVKGQ